MEKGEENEKSLGQQPSSGQNEQWAAMNDLAQGMNNGNFGFDGTNNFPNMGFNEFNSMMQFLPNGMPNPMMASFPNMMGKLYDKCILPTYVVLIMDGQVCQASVWIL